MTLLTDGIAGATGMGMSFSRDVAIVGGCGRVGLPLGLVLADAGLSVTLYDRDNEAVDRVRAGKMPFWENGADELLDVDWVSLAEARRESSCRSRIRPSCSS